MTLHTAFRFVVMAGILTAQTVIAASSAVRPTPVVPGDRCYRCDRLISDRWVAAETVTEDGVPYRFRTVRCMLAYLTATERVFERLYVADDQTGRFVDVERAVFVRVRIDLHTRQPNYGIGETDYVAFSSLKAAERFAADRGEETMSWPAVVFEAAFLTPPQHARN